jgi:hypothetical protein
MHLTLVSSDTNGHSESKKKIPVSQNRNFVNEIMLVTNNLQHSGHYTYHQLQHYTALCILST